MVVLQKRDSELILGYKKPINGYNSIKDRLYDYCVSGYMGLSWRLRPPRLSGFLVISFGIILDCFIVSKLKMIIGTGVGFSNLVLDFNLFAFNRKRFRIDGFHFIGGIEDCHCNKK